MGAGHSWVVRVAAALAAKRSKGEGSLMACVALYIGSPPTSQLPSMTDASRWVHSRASEVGF
ncbi:hypothetical protein BLX42_04165 [Pseudomonas sp. SG-MS2]|nr:hypothetical protein BLX42_04165 [Pseudomonas sp. SG-MS2]